MLYIVCHYMLKVIGIIASFTRQTSSTFSRMKKPIPVKITLKDKNKPQ